MTLNEINYQKLAAMLICILIVGYLLVAGKTIFAPIAFSIFLAFMLYPICNFFEAKGLERTWSISFTFILLFLLIAVIFVIFSSQLFSVLSDLPGLQRKLTEIAGSGVQWFEENFKIEISKQWMEDNFSNIIQAPLAIIGASIKSSTTLVANIILTIIYTVLLLLYRTSLRNFWLIQFEERRRDGVKEIIAQIQTVVQKYLYGLMMVITLLGVLNSLGLWAIGVDYPVFWGFFAGFLAIIPYVGTFVGAFLPFIYTLVTTSTLWQPTAVVLLFVTIQQIEGNIITPKLVGSNIKINPLAAIFSLIVGGYLWGIAGLILALPTVAVLKIYLDNVETLKPVGALLSSELYKKEHVFHRKYNQGIYRIFKIFSKKQDQ